MEKTDLKRPRRSRQCGDRLRNVRRLRARVGSIKIHTVTKPGVSVPSELAPVFMRWLWNDRPVTLFRLSRTRLYWRNARRQPRRVLQQVIEVIEVIE